MELFSKKLLSWYEHSGRKKLPWQQNQTAYRVWLSEIMLQQTQVTTVIDYFNRFTTSFPTIETLAQAHIDQVLAHWAGLGYYSRARNIHKTAQIIYHQYNKKFPTALAELIALPGIGRSTAGAILSFAYQIPTPILDGNVKRVLTRLAAIPGFPNTSQVEKKLWALAIEYTPKQKQSIRAYTQAIMDLGATICTRSQPKCTLCPVQTLCQAFKLDQANQFPHKKPKKILPIKTVYFIVLANQDNQILLERRPELGIWGGLWSFPELTELTALPELIDKLLIDKFLVNQLSNHTRKFNYHKLDVIQHSFSHYKLHATPIMIKLSESESKLSKSQLTAMAQTNVTWQTLSDKLQLGVPKPVSQLLKQLAKIS